MPPVSRWAIAVHAGAGAPSPDAPPKPYEHELNIALQAAEHVLHTQTVSIDWHQAHVKPPPLALAAALAAVECLETTPLFNAGSFPFQNHNPKISNIFPHLLEPNARLSFSLLYSYLIHTPK